ncbi:MAG: peptidoglycan DD-metalloendopeptidase family protein [Alkalimonas sp.]|nr:peptidoglycan DD-metalloendopeptidase family protein [Alkalimonas sp.]
MRRFSNSNSSKIQLYRRLQAVRLILWLLLALAFLGLTSCAKRPAPAPVASLQINPEGARGPIRADQYTVQRGDTLYSIAFRAGQDFRTLAQRNQISPPYVIHPGQQLRMSGAVTASSSAANPSTAAAQKTPAVVTTEPIAAVSQPVDSTEESAKKAPAKSVAPSPQTGYVHRTQAQNHKKTTNNTPSGNRLQWQWPTRGTIIARFSHQEHGSKGLKIAGSNGQRINAAASGQVVYAGNALRGYGNLIIIKHNDDYLSAYAHNQRLLVREQQHVSAGEHIADMGSTEASQTQLHFEIRFRGQSVDPLQFLPK